MFKSRCSWSWYRVVDTFTQITFERKGSPFIMHSHVVRCPANQALMKRNNPYFMLSDAVVPRDIVSDVHHSVLGEYGLELVWPSRVVLPYPGPQHGEVLADRTIGGIECDSSVLDLLSEYGVRVVQHHWTRPCFHINYRGNDLPRLLNYSNQVFERAGDGHQKLLMTSGNIRALNPATIAKDLENRGVYLPHFRGRQYGVLKASAMLHVTTPDAALLDTLHNRVLQDVDGLFWVAKTDHHQFVMGEYLYQLRWLHKEAANRLRQSGLPSHPLTVELPRNTSFAS